MGSDNPFNNLDDLPDRTATAVVAVALWLAIAVVLLRFAPVPFNWLAAAALSIHAGRTWWRFRRRAER